MKRWGLIMAVIIAIICIGFGGWWIINDRIKFQPRGKVVNLVSPDLEKYDFDSLRKRGGKVGKFEILGQPKEVDKRRSNVDEKILWDSRVFRFQSNGKWISGMINYRVGESRPVVIMVRGFAESEGYYPGFGSWKMADELAKSGLATVSIDFLGYGMSDKESSDPLVARFEKVMSVMDLLETVKTMPFVNPEKIGFWAHSNGGQIVLSVLEVTGRSYPTVLWAPMTNPFPQSILETADEGEAGEPVRQMVAQFEKKYDARRYAVENYYQWIRSAVKIFQGTADGWCKVEWQEKVVEELRKSGNRIELEVVQSDDHNFSKNWQKVATKSVDFLSIIDK